MADETLEPVETAQTEPISAPAELVIKVPTDQPFSTPEVSTEDTVQTAQPVPTPIESTAQMGRNEPLNPVRNILKKAQEMIQSRKRKKLEKIMSLFITKSKITNDEVEKYLHCSDATATRYLTELEKEGRIKQTGKTGQGVSYSKI